MQKFVLRLLVLNLFLVLFSIIVPRLSFARVEGIRGGMYLIRKDSLDTLGKEEKDAFLTKARNELEQENVVVTDKKQCLTGNRHNYESLSSYYWPDPHNPGGPYINKDGFVNPETLDYDREKIDKLAQRCELFANAYYISRDDCYYRAFVSQIDAWFINRRTRMNPNMQYSQVIKGKYHNQGQAHGIIDAYALTGILESLRLVNDIKPIPKRKTKALKSWFSHFSYWLRNSEQGRLERQQPNNHCPLYFSLLTNIGIFINDSQLVTEIIDIYPEEVLHRLIMEDGSQPGELIRTRAYHYSILSLASIVDYCLLLNSCGIDFWGENGDIIERGVSFLSQYAENRDGFPAQEIGNWENEVALLKQLQERIMWLKLNINK